MTSPDTELGASRSRSASVLRCRILDTLQEVFAMQAFYFYLIDNFDKPGGLLIPIWCVFHDACLR